MDAEGRKFVQFGAGYSAPKGWLSYDTSPTLRVQKLPMVGKVLAKLSGNASPFPDELLIGDIVKGLPLPAGSVAGLYASHVLEHLALKDMRTALKNAYALLMSGGVFRLIVPDLLARARAYVQKADKGDSEAAHWFMTSTYLGHEVRPRGLFSRIRAQLGNSAHLWMWDYATMEAELKAVGFVDIRRAQMGDSGEPMFDLVEDETRFTADGEPEVAIQARKP